MRLPEIVPIMSLSRGMFQWLRYTIVFLAAPLLAIVCASASLSTVLAKRAPERALKLPFADPNAHANLGVDSLAFAQVEGANRGHSMLESNALETFRQEPTNSTAISLLAAAKQLQGDTVKARRLYADSLMLSRRDRLANLALAEEASQRGWISFVLDRYDVLLRTGGATSTTLLDVMGTALQEQAILPHLEDRLAANPPWAEQFWLRVTPNQGAIENVGRLRLRLLAKELGNAAGNDPDIIRRLVENGHYELAYRLANNLTGSRRQGIFLSNASFDDAPLYVPFDWITFSNSRYSAQVDPVAAALVLFTETSSYSLMARQLLKIPQGAYSLRARIRNKDAAPPIALAARLQCANSEGLPPAAPRVELRNGVAEIAHPGACEFSWLEFWGRRTGTSQTATSTELLIDSIELRQMERTSITPEFRPVVDSRTRQMR